MLIRYELLTELTEQKLYTIGLIDVEKLRKKEAEKQAAKKKK